MELFSSVVGTPVDQISLLYRDVTDKLNTKWFILCLGLILSVFSLCESPRLILSIGILLSQGLLISKNCYRQADGSNM